MTTAFHALCPVIRVSANQQPPPQHVGVSVYAVFSANDDPAGAERFLGLVTPGQAAGYHERIFADLLPHPAPAPISAQTPLRDVVAHLDHEHGDVVAVLDKAGAFLGAVTRASLLDALLQSEPATDTAADTLYSIAQMLSTNAGESLFNKLVLSLTRALKIDYAYIGEIAPGGPQDTVQIVAICARGQLADNFSYELAGTPCVNVVGNEPCHYPHDIQQKFPNDQLLREMGIESYVGIPLFGTSQQRLGLLVAMDSKPMRDPQAIEAILQICAARVVAEFDRQYAQQDARHIQYFLNAVVENLPNMLFVKDAKDLRFVRFNKAAEKLLGYTRNEMLGKNDYDLFPEKAADSFTARDREVLDTGELLDIPREIVQTRHQGERLLHTRKIPILDAHGKPKYLLGISEDITERQQTEDQVARLGRILERSSNEIYVFDATTLKFTQVNQSALKNLGYTLKELRSLTPIDLKLGYSTEQFQKLLEPLRLGEIETLSFETDHARKDGSHYPVEVRLQFSRVELPPVFVAVISDITEHRQTQERLNQLAYYDALTGLPNRLLLLDRLRHAMANSARHERLVAIMFLDLDRFKLVNDTLGHGAGDALLKESATRLNQCVRQDDTIARLGGDEFTIVLTDVAHVDHVAQMAQKILDVFVPPFTLNGQEVFITPSIGITLYPLDDNDPELLLKNADAAMYHAKDSGRNNFQFFTPELNARAARRFGLETALRHALEREEFVLHYQPQIDLTNGKVMGVEALIRWQRPNAGMVSPLDFIPLAEETGLIVPIGEWVLRTACAQNHAWQKAGLPGVQMSVNIAARQFQQQNLATVVARILQQTGLEARWLMLEITEGTVMHDTRATIKTLQQIGALGVELSMDDFGTGYSSLSYLKRFSLNYLKIDKSFIDDITTDPNDAAIATAIISMAANLDIKVIAEGVETLAQLNFLCAHGCNAMQGYYFSKPLPLAACTALLTAGTGLKIGPPAKSGFTNKKPGAQARRPATKQRKTAKREVAKKKITKRKTAKRKTAKKK